MGILDKLFGKKTDFSKLLEEGAIVIDVRSKAEFKQGHPKGAVNIPLDQIEKKLTQISGHKKPVITCCASGARSGRASTYLNSQGIEAFNGGPWQNISRHISHIK